MLSTVARGHEVARIRAPYAEAREDLEAIAGLVSEAFAIARARVTVREVNGAMEARVFIPDVIQVRGQAARPLILTARVGLPSETEIGAVLERRYAERYGVEVGAGKVARKIKKAAKKVVAKAKTTAGKVAKSKVFKTLKKVAIPLAAVVPGLQPLAAGLAVTAATRKVISAAKKGSPKAKAALQKVARGAKKALANVNKQARLQLATPKAAQLYLVADADGNEHEVTL